MRRFRRTLLSLVLGLPIAMSLTFAARAEGQRVSAVDGIAIGGYDAVAYFTLNRAVKGSPEHALMWRGATWLFSSTDTMALFEMNPKAYAPQFGGYCALAVAEGRLAGGDPTVFTLHDGRLYLSMDGAALGRWASDMDANIARAEARWPDLVRH